MQIKHSYKYIAFSLIMAIVMTFYVGSQRMAEKQTIGFKQGTKLERAVRSHGNFMEYTPLFLIGLVAAETLGACVYSTNIIGSVFMLGRVAHALSLNYFEPVKNCLFYRKVGMVATMLSFLALALFILIKACKNCCKKECKIACSTKGECKKEGNCK